MSRKLGRRRLGGMNPILTTLLFLTGLFGCRLFGLAAAAPSTPTLPQDARSAVTQKVATYLWFDDDAEEAVRFYTSLFPDSKVLARSTWGDGGPMPKGSLMTARFTLAGHELVALNGGPMFHFNEAISLMVRCEDQAEIDRLWQKLTEGGGKPGQCGWLKDKFGLSWQIVPASLETMLQDKDPAKVKRVTSAFMQMTKFDLAALQRAYEGR